MPFKLDEETRLTPLGDGQYRRPVTQYFWNMENAFGGWSVALAIKAVELKQETGFSLSSVTASFIQAVPEGELLVTVATLRQSRRTGFFRVEFRMETPDAPPIFTADIIMSDRGRSDLEFHTSPPDIPKPGDIERAVFEEGPRWFPHFDQRRIEGKNFTVAETPRNLLWIREDDGRPLDAVALGCISDTLIPRTFLMSEERRFSSTVSYSLYMFANRDELAAVGNDYLLLEGDSDCVRNGACDQKGRIWSKDGNILATTSQISFFR